MTAARLLAAFLSLALSALCSADGIPVNRQGEITVPYSLITPTASQVEEVEALNSITLTRDQWAGLRKVSPNTPKRLVGILPVTWNDCTCGVAFSAIQMKDGRIAILHDDQTPRSISWRIGHGRPLELRVDRRGQFHLQGILVRFQTLLEAIRASREIPGKDENASWQSEAWIRVPPGMDPREPVFKDRAIAVYRELAAKGWNDGEVPEWQFTDPGED